MNDLTPRQRKMLAEAMLRHRRAPSPSLLEGIEARARRDYVEGRIEVDEFERIIGGMLRMKERGSTAKDRDVSRLLAPLPEAQRKALK